MPGKRTFSQFSQSQGPKKPFHHKHYIKQRPKKTLAAKINKLARDLKPEVKYIITSINLNNAGGPKILLECGTHPPHPDSILRHIL